MQGESHRDPWRHVSPKHSSPLPAYGVTGAKPRANTERKRVNPGSTAKKWRISAAAVPQADACCTCLPGVLPRLPYGVDCLCQHHFVPAWPAGVVVDRRIFSNSAARGEPRSVESRGLPGLPVDRRQDDCRSSLSLPQFHRGLHTWRHHINSRTSNWTFSQPAPLR